MFRMFVMAAKWHLSYSCKLKQVCGNKQSASQVVMTVLSLDQWSASRRACSVCQHTNECQFLLTVQCDMQGMATSDRPSTCLIQDGGSHLMGTIEELMLLQSWTGLKPPCYAPLTPLKPPSPPPLTTWGLRHGLGTSFSMTSFHTLGLRVSYRCLSCLFTVSDVIAFQCTYAF